MFLGIFRNTNSVTVCQNSVFAKFWVVKNEVFEKKIAFFVLFFYVGEMETEKRQKRKWKRPKHPIKISFLRWSSKNVKNQKNRFLAKIAWHYLCQEGRKNAHFRAHYLFWPKFFWTKTVQSRKHYKNRGFSGNCKKKQKWHLFLEKSVFWHGWKSGFY